MTLKAICQDRPYLEKMLKNHKMFSENTGIELKIYNRYLKNPKSIWEFNNISPKNLWVKIEVTREIEKEK